MAHTFLLKPGTALCVRFSRGDAADRLEGYGSYQRSGAKNFYDEFYERSSTGLTPLRSHQARLIAEFLGLTNSGEAVTWIDIGCGTGDAVRTLNETSGGRIQAFGIDPSAKPGDNRIRRIGLEEFADEKEGAASYDYISFLDVLEHFEDPLAGLRLALARLKTDGALVIKVPVRTAAIYRMSKALRFLAPPLSRALFQRLYQVDYPPPHHWYFDGASLERLCTEAGLRIEAQLPMSETPLRFLWGRLWGLAAPVRVAAFAAFGVLSLFSVGSLKECLVVVARRPSAAAGRS
jgi:SAM-dependent methyltransferase